MGGSRGDEQVVRTPFLENHKLLHTGTDLPREAIGPTLVQLTGPIASRGRSVRHVKSR